MLLERRQLLHLAALTSALPAVLHAARAQGGPKLTPILRGDLVGQGGRERDLRTARADRQHRDRRPLERQRQDRQ